MASFASISLAANIAVRKFLPVGMLWSLKACSESTTEGYGSCCTHRTSKGHWRTAVLTGIKSKILTDTHRARIFQSPPATYTGYVSLCGPGLEKSPAISRKTVERDGCIFHQLLSKKRLGLTGMAFCACYSLPLMDTSLLDPLFLE